MSVELTPNQELWLTALESGRYLQGTGELRTETRNGNRFCCLGVACEVAIENGVPVEITHDHADDGIGAVRYDGSWAELPDSVADWLDLPYNNPYIGDKSCSSLNDVHGKTFPEIAAAARENGFTHER